MRRLISISVLSVALIILTGCAREDPRASRENLLEDERSRSTQQVAELRDRMAGQSQR